MAATGYVSPFHRALIYVLLGEHDASIRCLREASAINEGWLAWLAVEPQFDPLRADPAFIEILAMTKNPARAGAATTKAKTSAASLPRSSSSTSASRDSIITSVTSPVPSPAPQTLDSGNEEARQLYTAGRYYATRRTAEGMRQAIERLSRAVEID